MTGMCQRNLQLRSGWMLEDLVEEGGRGFLVRDDGVEKMAF